MKKGIGIKLIILSIGALAMLKKDKATRGIRNNNPGNIEKNGINWDGLSPTQTDSRFYQFQTPEYGIRAMARILKTYQSAYGLNTIEQIINRWAPPNENNTASYVEHVSAAVGVEPGQIINVNDIMPELIAAIIKHENGKNPYSEQTIEKGVMMA